MDETRNYPDGEAAARDLRVALDEFMDITPWRAPELRERVAMLEAKFAIHWARRPDSE